MTGDRPADPDWSALEELRGRITDLDGHVAQLLSERQSLVREYEQHRYAIIGRLHRPGPSRRRRPQRSLSGGTPAGMVGSPEYGPAALAGARRCWRSRR